MVCHVTGHMILCYTSFIGTFMYDMPAERDKVKLSEKTESLW